MNIRYAFFILSVLILTSCGEERRKREKKQAKPTQSFVFNMESMFSEAENQMSFPIWFDEETIKDKKVKTITRSIYPVNASSSVNTPKETKIYSFDERGLLQSVSIRKFYENMVVEDVTFKYSDVKDKMGFANVEIINDEHPDEELDDYVIHHKEKYSKKFLVYANENTGDYLFYMLNEKNWGALSVDSMLQPTPSDLIVLGSPSKPVKKYNVHNTVSESNVVDLNYRNDGEVLESVAFEQYPFYYKRHIKYDKGGYCKGFIDSTFTANEFLTRTVSTFKLNKMSLPEKLIQSKPGGGGYEIFEYSYYENKIDEDKN